MQSLSLVLLLLQLQSCNGLHSRDIRQKDIDINTLEMKLNSTLMGMASQLFGDRAKSVGEVEKEMMTRMDATEAQHLLADKLPKDVAALVAKINDHKAKKDTPSKLNDADIERAIGILNEMIEQAWVRLDVKITEYKEFELRNRGTYDQVMIDLARLGSQIADAEGDRAEATQEIAEIKSQIKLAKEARDSAEAQYLLIHGKDAELLKLQENERAVWNFIMQVTNCATFGDTYAENTFVQLDGSKICQNDKHEYSLVFTDPKVQARLQSLLTAESRQTLNNMLKRHPSFLQQTPPNNETATSQTLNFQPTTPVNDNPPAGNGQWKKCSPGTPNCGLLHDTISLQWGGYRDLVDETKQKMAKDTDAWNEQVKNFNEQERILREANKHADKQLADAIKRIDTDTEEKNQKNDERLELQHEYNLRMKVCKAEISEILYTFICGVRVTRNVMITQHTTIKLIIDCDVTDWVPGPCSVPCDDVCPVENDPNACGGTHTLKREIIQQNDQWGVKCPALSTVRRCNQKKCPVDCLQSQWSAWSACTKVCGGGMQGSTRDILVPPKNGGASCDADADTRPCNTHSCDRDCDLSDWTTWTGCSQACGGGTRYRKKLVTRPIRGNGECPKADSDDRLEREFCNQQNCFGDEICIAQQDLVLAIDASGSLKESGFKGIQNFARNLTARYQKKYYGIDAMKVGVVEFGNGNVSKEGLISPAQTVHSLTFDLTEMRESIAQMSWLRGFTNMAQALEKADEVLSQRSRKTAHSGILLITDGKATLPLQTTQKADKLKAKNIMIYAAVISESETDDTMKLMKGWVSQPWDTNLVRIPNHKILAADPEVFVQQVITKFCPRSISPTQNKINDMMKKYILIHENAYPDDSCGVWVWRGYPGTMDDCASIARDNNQQGFAYGFGYRLDACYSEAITVTTEIWENWVANREDPPCPNGQWILDVSYDTYMINPNSLEETQALSTPV